MMRDANGPMANAILREIGLLTKSVGPNREKPILVVEAIRSIDWASLTFVGQRHELDLRLEGDAEAVVETLAAIARALPESDIPVPGSFVAEIAVTAGSCAVLVSMTGPDNVAQSFRIEALGIRD